MTDKQLPECYEDDIRRIVREELVYFIQSCSRPFNFEEEYLDIVKNLYAEWREKHHV